MKTICNLTGNFLRCIPAAWLWVTVGCQNPVVVIGSDLPLQSDTVETETADFASSETADSEESDSIDGRPTDDDDTDIWDDDDSEHGRPYDTEDIEDLESDHEDTHDFPNEETDHFSNEDTDDFTNGDTETFGEAENEGDDGSDTTIVCEMCVREFCSCSGGEKDEQLVKSCSDLQAECLNAECASEEAPNFGQIDCGPFIS